MVYCGDNDYRDYLAHHGVKGMKWGIRRYQPYSYTGGTGKEVGLARRRSHFKGGETAKNVVKTAGKAIGTAVKKIATKGAEIHAARKAKKIEDIVRSGSLKTVKRNRRKLTTEELTDAYNRIEKEARVADLIKENRIKTIERGKRAIESMAATIGSSIKMYKDIKSVADGISAAKSNKKADRVIRTGDANAILEALPTMTDDQVQRALKRLDNKAGIERIRDKRGSSSENQKKQKNNNGGENNNQNGQSNTEQPSNKKSLNEYSYDAFRDYLISNKDGTKVIKPFDTEDKSVTSYNSFSSNSSSTNKNQDSGKPSSQNRGNERTFSNAWHRANNNRFTEKDKYSLDPSSAQNQRDTTPDSSDSSWKPLTSKAKTKESKTRNKNAYTPPVSYSGNSEPYRAKDGNSNLSSDKYSNNSDSIKKSDEKEKKNKKKKK